MSFAANQWARRPSLTTVFLWAAGAICIGGLAWLLSSTLSVRHAWVTGAVVPLVLSNWSALPVPLPAGISAFAHTAIGLLAALAAGLVAGRLIVSDTAARVGGWFAFGAGAATLASLLVAAQLPKAEYGTTVLDLGSANTRPDLYFIVLDGYARADVLRDDFGFSNDSFLESLKAREFVSNSRARSEYSMTYASLSTTLLMSHAIEPGAPLGRAERLGLYAVLGGDNLVIRSLQAAGYRYIHLESGWGGTRCGGSADVCVESRWQETLDALVDRTPFRDVWIDTVGSSFSRASVSQLDALEQVVKSQQDDEPEVVFAHILLPHAPLHVTGDCTVRAQRALSRLDLGGSWMSTELLDLRKHAYVEQVRCVNRRMLEIIDSMPEEAVVILVSDHGPDSRGQLGKHTTDWDAADLEERFSVLNAIRIEGCDTTSAYGVDLFRVIFDCHFGTRLGVQSDRQIIVNVDTVHPLDPVVERIASGHPAHRPSFVPPLRRVAESSEAR